MDIATFVNESLQQIIKGVGDAQDSAKDEGRGAKVNPRGRTALRIEGEHKEAHDIHTKLPVKQIEFDIAVTTYESSGKSGGVGLRVYGVGVGGDVDFSAQTGTASRIRFSVPVVLPDPYAEKDNEDTALQEV